MDYAGLDNDLGYELPQLEIPNIWELQTALVDDHYRDFTLEQLEDLRSYNIQLLTHLDSGQSYYLNAGLDEPICPDYIAGTIGVLSETIEKLWIDTLCNAVEKIVNAHQAIESLLELNTRFVFFKKMISSLFEFYFDFYLILAIEDELMDLIPDFDLFTDFDFEDDLDFEPEYAIEHDGSGC